MPEYLKAKIHAKKANIGKSVSCKVEGDIDEDVLIQALPSRCLRNRSLTINLDRPTIAGVATGR